MRNNKNQRIELLNKKLKFSDRYSAESLSKGKVDDAGSWFVTQSGKTVDVSKVKIVGVFVDTVRQLYNGVLDEGFLHVLESAVSKAEHVKMKASHPSAKLPLGEFHVQKMGKASGYRYKLQNNEIGLVVLVGGYYGDLSKAGNHLKIECSPHFIALHNPLIFQARLDSIARSVLHEWDYQGVAVHLAVDVQGWKPGAFFLDHFTTYARFVRQYNGLSTAEIGQGFSDVVAKYGEKHSETITIGKPTGLQTSIYNKTKQAVVIDKVDHYQKEWGIHSLGAYDSDGPDVWRVEYRFHHSVIRDMDFDGKTGFVNFLGISDYLGHLWKYAVLRNRLDIDHNHIHPVWQLLLDDVKFSTEPPSGGIKRVKKNDLAAIGKNIELLLGNFMSIYARKSDKIEGFFKQLRRLEVYDDILEYYRVERKIDETDFREKCERTLKERRMLRNAA